MQTKYKLPTDLKMRCMSLVRGYERMLEVYEEKRADIICGMGGVMDGQPRGNGVGDATFSKAEQLLRLEEEYDTKAIRVIDQAKFCIAAEDESAEEGKRIADAVMDSCVEGRNFVFEYRALYISKSSFYRLRQKFLYDIAVGMGFI